MIYFVVSLESFVVRITSETNGKNGKEITNFLLRNVDISWQHLGQVCHHFKWSYNVILMEGSHFDG